jgi:NADH pyrophosphatase NudC (nudix superfamily)
MRGSRLDRVREIATAAVHSRRYHPGVNFCPRCGTPLVTRADGGRSRPSCPAEGCGFYHYGDFSIGVGAVVLRDERVLLIERRTPTRTFWQTPGGYVEADESIHAAVEREVLEETGVTACVVDVVGFRHAASVPDRPVANIYVVFRLDAVTGEPRPDGIETFDAGFFTLEEAAAMPGLSAESFWFVRTALETAALPGFTYEEPLDSAQRPGRSLFGLRLNGDR